MTPHPDLEKLLNWLLNHSLQAGVLVLLVLAVQWIFRRQLTHRWRFALWWIVLVRLLLPFSPQSAVSVFNYFQPRVSVAGPRYPATPVAVPTVTGMAAQRTGFPHPGSQVREVPDENVSDSAEQSPALQNQATTVAVTSAASQCVPHPVMDFGALIVLGAIGLWLAGVLALSVCAAVQTIRFRSRLTRASRSASPAMIGLFNETRQEATVTRPIALLETDAVNSPALYGFWRLRLLLPRGLEEKFTPRELRYIFLHELAHVKRGDLWLNWLVTGLQILHWFNPLVWFGFARLRADRELACDELALVCAGDQAGTSYGETVIKLLENLSRPAAIPGLMGILEDKRQMRRRISMIAKFRKPGRWSVMAVLLIGAVAATTLTDAQTGKSPDRTQKSRADQFIATAETKPDLTGQVLAKDGASLPVTATVFIATAGPKVGTSPFCPSCYADCQKSAKTDAQGNFEISSLDPQLRFQVLAVAKGFKPKYADHVDPAKGPITVKLEPIEMNSAPPGNCLHGRIVDAQGKPVAGAVIEAHGIRTLNGGGRWGGLPGVDPLAVADEHGEFLITSQKPFDQMDVKVSARGFANRTFTELASGSESHELKMTEGASVRGRVMFNGRPLTNILVGVVSVNRDMEHFTGNFDVGTDSDGRFLFVNLPPNVEYFIYGAMDSLKSYGAIPIQKIHSGKDGELTDIGNLVVGPAHRLAGRVVLADGATVPPNTRLLVSREDAWDSRQINLPPDGRFDIAGVPTGTLTLSLRLKGYRVSAKNASLDTLNPFQLVGRVDGNITNLEFLLEKGDNLSPNYNNNMPESDWPQNRPLRGAEGGADHSHEVAVTGRVTDRQTGEPLAHFRVTPGSANLTWKRNTWNIQKTADGTNGNYTVYLDPKWAQPVLKVEADGYLPASVLLRPLDQTNADLTLEKGSGPNGTVVSPDGKPVAKADVLLVCADSDQPGFDYEGHLNARFSKDQITTTDADGHFSLAPQLGMRSIAVSSANGFSQVSMETLATNSTIVLEPFGTIKGVLNRPTGPGTNEDLDLAFVDDGASIYQRINLSNHTVTDTSGHFEFDRVPAGKLQISYRLKMTGGNGWQNIPLQQVALNPGQTLEVNIAAPARQLPANFGSHPTPEPAREAGVKIEGVVLRPNGKPAAGAQVAVQVTGKYLSLGKAAFKSYAAWQDGSIVRAGPDGKFSLPMYVGAKSVIALNDDGYVQVSLEDLKRSLQITLQPWGRIEGTVRLGQHFLTNASVVLSDPPRIPVSIRTARPGATNNLIFTNSAPEKLEPPIYDFEDFQARTDDQGRFVIAYVPPGEQTIARLVPEGNGAQMHSPLGTVLVKPGEVAKVQFGGGERTVTGKVVFADSNAPKDLSQAMAILQSGFTFNMIQRLQQAKTQEERMAVFESDEYRKALAHQNHYSVKLADDQSFTLEGVAPGNYEFGIQLVNENEMAHSTTAIIFTSPQKIFVPKTTDTNDDAPVDLGTIELKKLVLPKFPSEPPPK
jgi:beta-lactamase regulating signal transducer with metallopeptidase domain/uncharacterized GH25 family protein